MKTINLTIDDTPVSVNEGTTILLAAETIGVHIPRPLDGLLRDAARFLEVQP